MKATPSMALSRRLILAITAATMLLLALILGYLDHAMRRGFIHEHEELLEDHVASVERAVIEDPATLHEVHEILHHAIGGDKNEKSYGLLATAAQEILVETPGFTANSPPLNAYPTPRSLGSKTITIQNAVTPEHQPVFITAATIARPAPAEPLIYYISVDAKPERAFMHDFRLKLAGAALIGTILSAALAAFIVRRSLRPLCQITAEIEATTSQALEANHETTPPPSHHWPEELVGLASAFTSLRGRLALAFQKLQQFSDDAAHEIRTPLHNLLNLASLTLQRERTPAEYRSALESTLEECERLRRLSDGLLFISRTTHGQKPITLTTFDAAQSIQEVVEFHEGVASEKGIAMKITAAGNVTADRMLFRQALTNLLSNALRHTPSGGQVEILCKATSPTVAQLIVRDNGEGIAPDHLPHIFNRFYRVDAARTTPADAPPQTGLGLAIVQSIVKLHSGHIRAESTPGQGSTFTIEWPAPPHRLTTLRQSPRCSPSPAAAA